MLFYFYFPLYKGVLGVGLFLLDIYRPDDTLVCHRFIFYICPCLILNVFIMDIQTGILSAIASADFHGELYYFVERFVYDDDYPSEPVVFFFEHEEDEDYLFRLPLDLFDSFCECCPNLTFIELMPEDVK